jgi:predicted GIY-YIG superfamily endonuclease
MGAAWYVYILECADGTFYTGMSSDPELRVAERNAGLVESAYTFTWRPVRLIWAGVFPERDAALAVEHRIKGWSRAKKAALIRGDWDAIHGIVRYERRRRQPPPR